MAQTDLKRINGYGESFKKIEKDILCMCLFFPISSKDCFQDGCAYIFVIIEDIRASSASRLLRHSHVDIVRLL